MRAGVLPEQMEAAQLPSVSAQQRTAARPISSSVHWSNLVLGGYAGGNDGGERGPAGGAWSTNPDPCSMRCVPCAITILNTRGPQVFMTGTFSRC